MNKTTFEEYKSAIKAQYDAKKIDGIYGSGDISNITPAQLRDLCLHISEMGLTKTDESTFRFFFTTNGDEKLGMAINNFNTGKLKSVISFLKGGKKSENRPRIELAAIIVDFNPRPFKRYSQNRGIQEINGEVFLEEKDDDTEGISKDLSVVIKKGIIATDNKTMNKRIIIFIAFISLFFMGYSVKNIIFPTKECMQWKENHYEAVDCSNDKLGIGQWNLIIPLDESIMKLKKLDSKKELVFFENDTPIVWYYKKDGEIELFNQPGFYPETAKPLRPITNYIIQKYKLKCKD